MKWRIHRLPKRKVANPFRLPGLAQLQQTQCPNTQQKWKKCDILPLPWRDEVGKPDTKRELKTDQGKDEGTAISSQLQGSQSHWLDKSARNMVSWQQHTFYTIFLSLKKQAYMCFWEMDFKHFGIFSYLKNSNCWSKVNLSMHLPMRKIKF